MRDERVLSPHPLTTEPEPEITGIPLPVVPDWDAQVRQATRMARLIDRHLDFEAYSRSVVEAEQLTPRRLCPEQRVDLATDISAVVGPWLAYSLLDYRKDGTVKKVHRHVPDVPQSIADRGTEIVERHFQAYGVKRAMDLPEEGKVHLMREMRSFFAAELPGQSEVTLPRSGVAGWWERVCRFLQGG